MSGDLTVAEGGGSVRARTISGAIALDLGASGERDIQLSSVSGDLTVRLPEASDLEVKLESTSGQVASAFEELEHERAPGRHAARGRLGAGTGRLQATSTSGHVALLRAPEARVSNPRGAPMSPVFSHGRLRLYLLKLLDESPRHGYDVIRLLEDRFMGLYAPSPGTIYPRLQRLEAEGLVTQSQEGGRKVYRITDAGREELAGRRDELDELEAEISGSVHGLAREIRDEVRGTVATSSRS